MPTGYYQRHYSAAASRFNDERYIPEPNSGCWLWLGALTDKGYGTIHERGKNLRAHRVSYEMHHGPIPEGMVVCHRCDMPCCVNPAHLWLGTQLENVADRDAKGRHRLQRRPRAEAEPAALDEGHEPFRSDDAGNT